MDADMNITVKAHDLRDFEAASSREWLVTNGIGGYASGTLSGANTRRYHGLLVAALTPPTGRMTLLSKVDETITVGGDTFELSANEYPGAIHPQGWQYLERFDNYPAPAFYYRARPDVLIRKQIWMARAEQTTYIRYTLAESAAPVDLRLTPLVCWKDFHSEMHPWDGFPTHLDALDGETRIRFTPDSPDLRLLVKGSRWEAAGYWHYNVVHARERERGLDFNEDLYCPGHFLLRLKPGASCTLIATIEANAASASRSWAGLVRRQKQLVSSVGSDTYSRHLALAADQFVIEPALQPTTQRPNDPTTPSPTRSTIIAGYHWFSDWGRDSMIALPGLCLETGRLRIARDILTSFAAYVSEGMLPNRFPDRGEAPEYNTVDATLWYFEAIRRYVAAASTQDGLALARDLWPVLTDILSWHVRGTRYGIGIDPSDGLLRAGAPGVQLTWMDARVGDWVVTPRMGKPVEINALWICALRTMEHLGSMLGESGSSYADRADQASIAFGTKFVRSDGFGLYDVLTDEGPDLSIRPNQILAVSLPNCQLTLTQQESVVRTVENHLLTPYGLRTLSPRDPAFRAHYGGGVAERDSAYHQGTVWPWLLGPFVEAHLKVFGRPEQARRFLLPLQTHLFQTGIGSISEVFDAEPQYFPNGCIAQAWSVAEVFRAWRLIQECRKNCRP